jgi:hypothetical protein
MDTVEEKPSTVTTGSEPRQYVKFNVLYTEDGHTLKSVPCTGVNLTLDLIKELLESGKHVQVHPYTREEWSGGKP